MNEPQAAEKWLYTTLAAAAGVTALVSARIYADEAPESGSHPCLVFAHLGGQTTQANDASRRILMRLRYSIRGIAQGASYLSADAIANALDAALTGQTGSATISGQDYAIIGCWQETPLRYPEREAGKPYRHAGGVYVVDIHATP